MQQLLHSNKKYAVGQSFFSPKIISLKIASWLQSCKMTGHEGAYFDYNEAKNSSVPKLTSFLFLSQFVTPQDQEQGCNRLFHISSI